MSSSVLQAAIRDFVDAALRDRMQISGLHIDGIEVTQSRSQSSIAAQQCISLIRPIEAPTTRSASLPTNRPAYACTYAIDLSQSLVSLVQ